MIISTIPEMIFIRIFDMVMVLPTQNWTPVAFVELKFGK